MTQQPTQDTTLHHGTHDRLWWEEAFTTQPAFGGPEDRIYHLVRESFDNTGEPWETPIAQLWVSSDRPDLPVMTEAREHARASMAQYGLDPGTPVNEDALDRRPSFWETGDGSRYASELLSGLHAERELDAARNTLARHGVDPTDPRPAHRFRFGTARSEIRIAQDTLQAGEVLQPRDQARDTAARIQNMIQAAGDPEWRSSTPTEALIATARTLDHPDLTAAYTQWAHHPLPTQVTAGITRTLSERAEAYGPNLTDNKSAFDLTSLPVPTLAQLIRAHDAAFDPAALETLGSREILRDFHRLSAVPPHSERFLPGLDAARSALACALNRQTGIDTSWTAFERAITLRVGDAGIEHAQHVGELLERLDRGAISPDEFLRRAVSGHPAALDPSHTMTWVGNFGEISNAARVMFDHEQGFGGLGGGDISSCPTYQENDVIDPRTDAYLGSDTFSTLDRPMDPGKTSNADEMRTWLLDLAPCHLGPEMIAVARDGDQYTVTIHGTEPEVNVWCTHVSESLGYNGPSRILCDGLDSSGLAHGDSNDTDLDLGLDHTTGARSR